MALPLPSQASLQDPAESIVPTTQKIFKDLGQQKEKGKVLKREAGPVFVTMLCQKVFMDYNIPQNCCCDHLMP